jgi:hypothetical protein
MYFVDLNPFQTKRAPRFCFRGCWKFHIRLKQQGVGAGSEKLSPFQLKRAERRTFQTESKIRIEPLSRFRSITGHRKATLPKMDPFWNSIFR